jgi:uncharacterized membrane protein YcaP (DUF421 family)
MKKEEIIPFDLKRMLFGQAPPEFLVEVLIRTLIVYLIAIVVLRLLGKRMNGQLSILEMSVMVLMGAILSLPMQAPDRGIVQGIVALLTVLVLLRGINWLTFTRPKLGKLIHGETVLLIKDGVMQLAEMRETHISKQQLFGVLRNQKIQQLGSVKRLYLETSGGFSVYCAANPKAGLPVIPPTDKEMTNGLQDAGAKACTNCGLIKPAPITDVAACANCGKDQFTKAVQ